MQTCQKCRMDLPDVDWFCTSCWLLDDQGNIPLVYTKVVGNQGNQSKMGDFGVRGGPTTKEKIVNALRKLDIVWGRLNRSLDVAHETDEILK